MRNNIKKAPVKFQKDLLYFQHFMLIFVLCPKLVIITTLSAWLIIGKGALWRSKIPADVMGPGFNGSLIVDTVSEAVTTGLNICEFLMKK